MTAPDVEGCSTKLLFDFLGHVAGHTASALLRGLAALARAPPPGGGGEAMAKPGADSAWNARLRVLARALALPAYAALFRPRSRLVPPRTPCFGRALRPSERVSSRGGHFQARLDWRISRGGASARGSPAARRSLSSSTRTSFVDLGRLGIQWRGEQRMNRERHARGACERSLSSFGQ